MRSSKKKYILYNGTMYTFESKLAAFFARHNFDIEGPHVQSTSLALLYDMQLGLTSGEHTFTQEMLPTWIQVHQPCDKKCIVLDAGGTNFRSYLVELKNGDATILKSHKGMLPATQHEQTAEQFFDAIAENIEYLKNESDTIHFCFAYAINMTPHKDATVLRMSKQVNVSGILHKHVGASLFEALQKRGWTSLKQVLVLNDTVAALLSGLSLQKNFSSYIGLILGTGFNIAYIESEQIPKLRNDKQVVPQIIVCESAKTNRVVASDFDKSLQEQTDDGALCKCEKMCSGAYLGKLISICLHAACNDGLFSAACATQLLSAEYSFRSINEFLWEEAENEITRICTNATADDVKLIRAISTEVLRRAARIVASALTAVALKTKAGTDPAQPICIVAEGTTFKKAFGLKEQVQACLEEHLTKAHGIYFELHEVDEAIVTGSAYFE